MEANFIICGDFLTYAIGINAKCYYCKKDICISYSAMEQVPKPFIPVCNECGRIEVSDKKFIFTAPSDFVMRELYEKEKNC